jgi:hypothetical protein
MIETNTTEYPLFTQQLRNQRDNYLQQGNLERALAISDSLGEAPLEGVLSDEELEQLRMTPGYRDGIREADRIFRGENKEDIDSVLEEMLEERRKNRSYGDLGPMSQKYTPRRQRSKKGENDPKNLALYQVAVEAGVTPKNAYDNIELVRRLLVEQRHMVAVTVGENLRESVYSADPKNVVNAFISSYERGRKLSENK